MKEPSVNLMSVERMWQAVDMVRERLLRSTAALDRDAIRYCVIGANAVAAWVATIDEGAIRNTPNVDLMIERNDLDRSRVALQSVGFVEKDLTNKLLFLHGPEGGSAPRCKSYLQANGSMPRMFWLLHVSTNQFDFRFIK